MERALQLLAEGGRFAMVTQDTYLDKEWAEGLRKLLATQSEVQAIVDLNPFGQLLLHAMNTPAVTVFDKRAPRKGSLVAVTTEAPDYTGVPQDQRRPWVLANIRDSLAALSGRRRKATVRFSTASRLPRRLLRETADKGWDLRPSKASAKFKQGWLRITDVLEARQGVTPGGCLDVFLMSDEQAKALGLETPLVQPAIKTREMGRWHPQWQERVLLYPYTLKGKRAAPAFTLKGRTLKDALDFETVLDEREREIRLGRPVDNTTVRDILEHRIALGLVKYPQTARYLVQHYARLEGRIFKKKRLEAFGRRWYEYLWPRDPRLLLATNRILSPTLVKEVRFALDSQGFLADHACLYLLPTAKTAKGRDTLRRALSQVLGRPVSDVEVLHCCLAFLNSHYAQETLIRRRPTPRGFYQISEQYLSEIPIVPPPTREDAETVLRLAGRLSLGSEPGERAVLETCLASKVGTLVGQ